MGIREFYAQYMNRPGHEYLPDPLGRLGQGKWVKTAQGPEAPTPPKPPTVPKPVPPTPPKGAPQKNGKSHRGGSQNNSGYEMALSLTNMAPQSTLAVLLQKNWTGFSKNTKWTSSKISYASHLELIQPQTIRPLGPPLTRPLNKPFQV